MKLRYERDDPSEYRMKWKVLVILGAVIFGYLALGGLAFYFLEGQEEKEYKFYIQNFTENFLDENRCVGEIELENLLKAILMAYDRGIMELGNKSSATNWDYASSVFFSITIVTTIGYGHIYPATVGGQAFCVLYAIFGIPLSLTLLAGIGHKLRQFFRWIDMKLDVCIKYPKVGKVFRVLLILSIGLICFLFLPAIMFVMLDEWTYGEALYYGFITLSTIGFGDLVPGLKDDGRNRALYRIMVGMWIFVGLAWLAGVITFIQEMLMNLLKKAQTNMDRRDSNSLSLNGEDTSAEQGEKQKRRDSYALTQDAAVNNRPDTPPPYTPCYELQTPGEKPSNDMPEAEASVVKSDVSSTQM